MPTQPETIKFTGSFARESTGLRRNHSVCSMHRSDKPSKLLETKQILGTINHPLKRDTERWNKCFFHVRYMIIVMGGLAVGFMSLLRLNITVAILNMVNQTQIFLEENPEGNLAQYFGENYEEVGEFNWDNTEQQAIIAYYMIAYTLPQLLTTNLAIKIGIKTSIPLCIGLCALSCLLTPLVAHYGWQYVMVLRLLNGFGASAILPLMVHLIELWMPSRESSLGLAVIQSVQSVLFTLSPIISATLASVHWKWAFYIPALVAIGFCIVWLVVVSDTPTDCWFISNEELNTICGCNDLHLSDGKESDVDKLSDRFEQASGWTKALKVKSFYALVAVWVFYCSSFGSFSFLVPNYLRRVLHVPIMENGMACFVMQCGCMISVIWPQPILRVLQNRYNFSLTAARRVVLAIICSVAIVTWLIVAAYHEYQVPLFAINRIFHLSTDTIVTSTIMSQYSKTGASSTVFSIINAIGNLSTVFFCMAAGEYLDISGQSISCWSGIFISMSLMNVLILILFSTVISSEPIVFAKTNSSSKPEIDVESEKSKIDFI